MGTGSNLASVVAVLLFATALVFAAAAVPTLASHSPGEGLDGVGDGLDASNVSGGSGTQLPGNAGGPGSTGSDGSGAGSESGGGDGLDPSSVSDPGGGGGAGGSSGAGSTGGTGGSGGAAAPAGAGGLAGELSPELLRVFGYFLELFMGGGAAPSAPQATPTGGTPQATPGTTTPGATPTPDATAAPGETATPGTSGTSDASTPTATPTPAAAGAGAPGGPSRTQAALFGGLLAAGLGAYLYRSDRGVVAALAALPAAARRTFMAAVLAVSDAVESAVRVAVEAASPLAIPGALLAALVESLRSVGDDVRAAVPWNRGGRADGPAADAAADSTVPARERVRSAWRTVVEAAVGGSYRRRTPGEVKRAAVDQGLPAGEVATVAESFRDVEYGGGDPAERVGPATAAAETLQRHLGRDGEDGADEEGDADGAADDTSGADSAADGEGR